MTTRIKSFKQLGRGAWKVARNFGGKSPARFGLKSRNGRDPQAELYRLIKSKYPEAVPELTGAVPGRKYEIDIAIPSVRLAIEVDGWQYHGKYKSGFLRDRQKDRALLLAGWRTLRFTAGEIFGSHGELLDVVEAAVRLLRSADEAKNKTRPE